MSDVSILPCARFFGEPCDPENCCGGRNSKGEIALRMRRELERIGLLSEELIEERKLEDLTDEEIITLWRAGRLRVLPPEAK